MLPYPCTISSKYKLRFYVFGIKKICCNVFLDLLKLWILFLKIFLPFYIKPKFSKEILVKIGRQYGTHLKLKSFINRKFGN